MLTEVCPKYRTRRERTLRRLRTMKKDDPKYLASVTIDIVSKNLGLQTNYVQEIMVRTLPTSYYTACSNFDLI